MAKTVSGWLKKGRDGNLAILRDPTKEEFLRLSTEFDAVQEHYKRLRGYVEHLDREYNEGKAVDVFRRYVRMKGMIKRTSMHLKVADIGSPMPLPTPTTTGGRGGKGLAAMGGLLQGTREFVKKAEQSRKREERLQSMSSEEVSKENRQLEEQIKDTKRRINLITELIRNLESQYNGSKRFFPIQRYRVMKYMVKNVTHSHLCRDS